MKKTPQITLILVCYNAEKHVETSLNSYLNQDVGVNNIEIIVVDGRSTDNTVVKCRNILEKSCVDYKIIKNEKRTLAAGWNLALKQAKAKFVCRIDAHSCIPNDYISAGLKQFESLPANSVAVGGVLVNKSNSFFGDIAKDFYSTKFGVGNSPFRIMSKGLSESDTAVFAIYKKSLFDNIGYFNESLDRNQDIEFHKRVIMSGYTMYTDYSLIIDYFVRSDLLSFIKKAYNDGFWVVRSGSYYTRHLIPLFFFIYLFSIIIFTLTFSMPVIYMPLGLYIILDFIFSLKAGVRNINRAILFTLFPLYHISYGFGSFKALFLRVFNNE
ncbi:glycosyltransferase family 2 protein [Photobacterium swingsii]|uniref:glycosyltransferase family 2 protein n=1 Tax=Photobacterium swingsii TaxID=680026 RepID=UPI0040695298